MSKLRRSNICSSPRNRNKTSDDVGDSDRKLKLNKSKLMTHGEFLNRIQKSLYYSGRKTKMSIPLSDYIADTFSDTHNGYSLNRLNYSTVGNLRSTPCSLILAMIYLERMKDADPAYTKHVTPTELFLVSMMVATKFYSGHDDEAPYVNWAEYANMSSDNLLQMEIAFLNAIDWKVFVSNEEFFEKVKSVEITLARRQGLSRGFLTYLELNSLMPSVQIAKQFIQTTLVLGFSYTVFVATMVASVFLVSQLPGTHFSASRSSTQSTELSSGNSSQIDANDTAMYSTTELIEMDNSNVSDLTVLIDLALDRVNDSVVESSDSIMERHKINTTSWIPDLLSSWYSLLKTDSFRWPVIAQTLDQDQMCYGFDANLCYNSSMRLLSASQEANRLEYSLSGIKMNWA